MTGLQWLPALWGQTYVVLPLKGDMRALKSDPWDSNPESALGSQMTLGGSPDLCTHALVSSPRDEASNVCGHSASRRPKRSAQRSVWRTVGAPRGPAAVRDTSPASSPPSSSSTPSMQHCLFLRKLRHHFSQAVNDSPRARLTREKTKPS